MKKYFFGVLIFTALIAVSNDMQAQYNRVAMDSSYIVSLTAQWKGERLPDGRPFVADKLLERLKHVVLTHAWGALRKNKFNNQYQGNWTMINPEIGRAHV